MTDHEQSASFCIGELARQAGTSPDTVRYYERLGLLGVPDRTVSGYRRYGASDLGRLQFIRRAKRLNLSLEEIRGLLGVAEEGECRPLRRQVVELLAHKITVCEAQLAELTAFKASLEERYRLALARLDEPTCGCDGFPATCGCLPVQVTELHGSRNAVPEVQRPTGTATGPPGAGSTSV
ncbi:MAG: MerR family transcriptional regulator [Chloroflexota bacterium]|nr:MerR family transcriptional regulator [Chloroflexota bacterium]